MNANEILQRATEEYEYKVNETLTVIDAGHDKFTIITEGKNTIIDTMPRAEAEKEINKILEGKKMTKYMLNNEKNGIELYFDSKPDADTITNLKSNGFRWHNIKKMWYAKQNEKTLKLAEQLTNGETIETVKEAKKESMLPDGIRFMYNGIKKDGELHKAWYSMGTLRGYEPGTITIYADGYSSLPRLEGLEVENDTDTMTDYFDKDKIRVTPDSKYYSIVKEAFDKQEAHRERNAAKREARRSAR